MRSHRLFNALVVGSIHSNETKSPSWDHFPSLVLPWQPYLYRPPGRNSCVEATSRSLSQRPAIECDLLLVDTGGDAAPFARSGASAGFGSTTGSGAACSLRV